MAEKTKVANTTVGVMTDGINVISTCPLCGYQRNMHTVKPNNLDTPYLVRCGSDEDQTGCHQWYVIRVKLSATVTGHSIQD